MPRKGEMEQNVADSDAQTGPVTSSGAGGAGQTHESEMEAGAEVSAPLPGRISPVDGSLITGEGKMLNRQQLNELRRKLRAKFH